MPRPSSFKRPKLNPSRYQQTPIISTTMDEATSEPIMEDSISSTHSEFKDLPHAIQISPRHVDAIINAVISKLEWKNKLSMYEETWMEESLSMRISRASVDVAFEILNDIVRQGES